MTSRIARIGLIAAILSWPGWVFAADAEQSGGSWFALIFYAINFLLFLWIVRVYGWPRVAQFFRNRSRTIRDNRSQAEKAFHEAQELATRAARLLRQLDTDKRTLMVELDEETTYLVRQINQAARDTVNRIRRDTESTTVALRDGAQRRLRRTMAEAAGRIARELLARNFQLSDQERLLRGFVEDIGEERRP
jgi:F0F1-type ATP synthase membrane subunit b/b'